MPPALSCSSVHSSILSVRLSAKAEHFRATKWVHERKQDITPSVLLLCPEDQSFRRFTSGGKCHSWPHSAHGYVARVFVDGPADDCQQPVSLGGAQLCSSATKRRNNDAMMYRVRWDARVNLAWLRLGGGMSNPIIISNLRRLISILSCNLYISNFF
jgi:hypothetical protein